MVPSTRPSATSSDPSGPIATSTHTNAARRSVASPSSRQQVGDAARIVQAIAAVPGGVDAGSAVERLDHDAGVVGHRQSPPAGATAAPASALMRALSMNVSPSSTGAS